MSERRSARPRPHPRASTPRASAPAPFDPRRMDLWVVTAPGLEAITAAECEALGMRPRVDEPGGISLVGGPASLYRANLHLRTASRVLVRIGTFHADRFDELERRVAELPWERYVMPGRPVRFRVTCRKSRLYHSDAVAERFARQLRRRVGTDIEVREAGAGDTRADAGSDEQLVIVRLLRDECTVSVDASGASLHARGYRAAVGRAPLRETLAAAMLLAARWDPRTPLADPMCGSGTIAIEGAMLARAIAPGFGRSFAFEHWAAFDASAWNDLRDQASAAVLAAAPAAIHASDRDAGAVAAAEANAERAGVAADLTIARETVSDFEPPVGRGAIVSNPPYGIRVGDPGPLRDLYARLGDVVRLRAAGWTLALLTADVPLERQLRLPLAPMFTTTNGGIPVRCMGGVVPRS